MKQTAHLLRRLLKAVAAPVDQQVQIPGGGEDGGKPPLLPIDVAPGIAQLAIHHADDKCVGKKAKALLTGQHPQLVRPLQTKAEKTDALLPPFRPQGRVRLQLRLRADRE